MFSSGGESSCLLVVGESDAGVADAVRHDRSAALEVDTVPADTVADTDVGSGPEDVLLIDGSCFDDRGTDVVARARETDPEITIAVVLDAAQGDPADVLDAGADDLIHRALVEREPAAVAERVRDLATEEGVDGTAQELFEGVSDGLLIHDPTTGDIHEVNERYCEITGYDRDELVGANVGLIVPDGAEGALEEAMARIERAREEGPQLFEFEGQRKDGERFLGEVHLRMIDVGGEERVLACVRDITERRELERTYRSVFENVSDGLVVHDAETGEIVEVNDRFCAMNGYEREELIGESIGIVHDPSYSIEEAEDRIARAKEGDPQLFEWRNQRQDGETFPVEVHLREAEILGESHILASVRDITERKRREQEYEQIFNGVNDGVTIHDPDTGEILDANETYLDIFGYDDVETVRDLGISGLSVTEEGYTEERARALINEVAESEEPRTVEWQIETAEGEQRWFESTVAPAEIAGENRVLAIQRDVTERKRREREYEQIFDGVQDGIILMDPESLELLDANEAYLDLLGYDDIEQVRTEGLDEISATEAGFTAERAAAVHRRVAEEQEPEVIEWRIDDADGETRWLDIKIAPAEIGGEDVNIAIHRDVTERRRNERRLRAILDRIDEAIFLAKAHEITQASQDPDYVSAGYEEIWGQPLAGIRDRYEDGFFGTLHPDDEQEYRGFMERIVGEIDDGSADDRYAIEYRIQTPDDETRWVRGEYYPIEWEATAPRIVIVSRDITERKHRERRLVSFEEATDDLATADASGEAAALAVKAATGTLELDAVAVLLYDEDGGTLVPEIRSEALPGGVADAGIGPGDGLLWECFATGSVVGADDLDAADRSGDGVGERWDDALADWRGIPLGNHGVLFIAGLDRSFEAETLQSAMILGSTLEAALNNIEGQQRLATQEEELRVESERAERLDRVARLTQRVEAAITEASRRPEVERAVCDRLVDVEPYEQAWIGGVEVGTDRLTQRSVAGDHGASLETIDLATTAETPDPHPAVEAWRSDAVAVENTVVTEGATGAWREDVLAEGYQSLCAVPLSYDGVTHGVLVIAARNPNAFDERTATVLEQLGVTIGHALAGIERRRALESDESVELEFVGEEASLPFAELAAATGCRVRHERTVRRDDGDSGVYYAVEEEPPDDVAGTAEQLLGGTVETVRDEDDGVLLEVVTDTWFGAPLAEYGAVLRRAEATAEETTVSVELPARSDVRSVTQRLKDLVPGLELEAKRRRQRSEETTEELRNRIEELLTDRQREALRSAHTAGYFEWPRESDGGEVAERLGITQPTFNKHLRLAEQKAFDAIFTPDR